jgi:aminomethyltransferase
MEDTGLQRSPLEAEHRALGAKLGAFGGWSMPIEYSGVLAEHRAVREAVGMFDVSHLGKIEVAGPGGEERLQEVLTSDLTELGVGDARYGLLLNDSGGIVDDLITYRVADDRWLVVPNASNVTRVLEALGPGDAKGLEIAHRPDLCTIAVQGPRSLDLVGQLFDLDGLAFMHCRGAAYRDSSTLVARSGYTGELGIELFVPAAVAAPMWRELLESGEEVGILPCGLGARDTLRLEMGYPLHGNDISEDRTPLEAGLSWAVAIDKGNFRGRDALLDQKQEGIPARLRGLRMEGKLIPRSHYPVFAGEEQVGETTSGTFSPTLRVGIALAYVSPKLEPGGRVDVDVRGRRGEAVVVKPPFVERSPR